MGLRIGTVCRLESTTRQGSGLSFAKLVVIVEGCTDIAVSRLEVHTPILCIYISKVASKSSNSAGPIYTPFYLFPRCSLIHIPVFTEELGISYKGVAGLWDYRRANKATLYAIFVRKSDYSYWFLRRLPAEAPNSSFFIPSQQSPVSRLFLRGKDHKSGSKAGFKPSMPPL